MDLIKEFENIGGQFFTPIYTLKEKLAQVQAFIFDWDGVFNDGTKSNERGSPFSEPDSMGVNMLRFSYWLKNGTLPFVYIITGENNITAIDYAKREHFNGIFLSYKNKATAIETIADTHSILPSNMAFFFDDIIDLSAAKICGLSFCIKREANPHFNDYIIGNRLCDYMSGHTGGNHAIREVTELLIGLNGNYEETISKRVDYAGEYEKYLVERNSLELNVRKRKGRRN